MPLVLPLAGCVDEASVDSTAQTTTGLFSDVTSDSIGRAETASPDPIDLSTGNPFFASFGTNGRTCGTCHQEAQGWTITPGFAQSRPSNDPLFVFDGSDCLPPGVANTDPRSKSTLMRSKALVRIDLAIPAGADFTLVSYNDPLHCPTPPSAADLRMYRRPLPAANSAFLATVMWDGRENVNPPNNTISLVESDLEHQANDATLGHAQATTGLAASDQASMMSFETGLFNAQKSIGRLPLDGRGVHGGGKYLATRVLPNFFIGINDVLGCAIPNSCAPGTTATFTSTIFTIFAAWEPGGSPPDWLSASIGRGERIFNTRSFPIDNVAGINRDPGDPISGTFTGFCGTCHDSPNVGNHSTSLPIDIGVTAASPVGGLDVSRLPTYTFQETATGRTITVTDPGRALVSGKFKDIGKTKGPNLRGLATRAPYFHNGSAADLGAVVDFYDQRFGIGFTNTEKEDLVAFLRSL